MKTLKWALAILILLYVLGFFLWVPVSLAGISYKVYSLTRAANYYDHLVYRSWVVPLGENNVFFKLRRQNAIFWCDRFEHCKAK